MENLRALSIKELRALIGQAGLTTEGCVDKSDLLERAQEAQQKLAAGGDPAVNADPEAIEAEVAALPRAQLLPALESAVASEPCQSTALRANACLQRITEAFMSGDAAESDLPRAGVLAGVLGGLKMGLGGQGGLFAMACMPLPFVLVVDEESAGEDDLGTLVEAAEGQHGVAFFETLLRGLAKFDQEHLQASILLTTQQLKKTSPDYFCRNERRSWSCWIWSSY